VLVCASFVFLSCATISPAGSLRQNIPSIAELETAAPNWQLFEDGIGFFHGKIANPQLDFWALQIDLDSANLQFTAAGGALAKDGSTLSTRVSSFVRSNSLIAGINAVPFDVISAIENRPIKNIGIVISGGELVAPAKPEYDALVFYSGGRPEIIKQSALVPKGATAADANTGGINIADVNICDIENAVGGFHQVLKNNEIPNRVIKSEARHPRSAAGISADGKRLYLLVIDGRRPGSIGATEAETALLLRALGSCDGINFDGGGSSALALRCRDGKVRVVNTPIHNRIPGMERAVAGCLGIRKEKAARIYKSCGVAD